MLEWLLGTKRFDRLARRRREAGIDPRWNLARLHEGTTFLGEYDARVDSRVLDATFLLRMVHRDAHEPSVLWHTVVRITEGNDGARVAHGVARSAPRQTVLGPLVAAPSIVRNLLEWNGPNLLPRDVIDSSCTHVEEADVEGFVDYVLLNSTRELPFLILTPSISTAEFLVDGEHVARRLAAMVRVARLVTPDAARKLTNHLSARGFDRKFGVFDGGARIYGAPLSAEHSPYRHYLWIGSRIAAVDAAERDGWLASDVAAQILRQTVPPTFFQSIEHHDRDERRRAAAAVLSKSVPPPPAPTPSEPPEYVALRARQKELEAALASAGRDYADLAHEYESLEASYKRKDEECVEKEQVHEELRDELEGKRLLIANLQDRLDVAKLKPGAMGLDDELRTALLAALHGRPTPEQSLLVVKALYPDRVIVHPKAINSAKQSEGFKHPDKVFHLLMCLVGPYWEALNSGKGDTQARVVLGSNYSPKESKTTMENKRAAELRTVVHNGRELVLWAHLKIGVKQDSDAETFRAHFEWLADERRILIGHCGPHLDLR